MNAIISISLILCIIFIYRHTYVIPDENRLSYVFSFFNKAWIIDSNIKSHDDYPIIHSLSLKNITVFENTLHSDASAQEKVNYYFKQIKKPIPNQHDKINYPNNHIITYFLPLKEKPISINTLQLIKNLLYPNLLFGEIDYLYDNRLLMSYSIDTRQANYIAAMSFKISDNDKRALGLLFYVFYPLLVGTTTFFILSSFTNLSLYINLLLASITTFLTATPRYKIFEKTANSIILWNTVFDLDKNIYFNLAKISPPKISKFTPDILPNEQTIKKLLRINSSTLEHYIPKKFKNTCYDIFIISHQLDDTPLAIPLACAKAKYEQLSPINKCCTTLNNFIKNIIATNSYKDIYESNAYIPCNISHFSNIEKFFVKLFYYSIPQLSLRTVVH